MPSLLSPFYVLYDLRVASLHLSSAGSASYKMDTVTSRLGLPNGAPFFDVYDALAKQLTASYRGFVALL